MHPILAQRGRLALYLVAWLPVGGLIATFLVFEQKFRWPEALALVFPLILVYAFLCLAAWYLCRAFPLKNANFLQLAGTFTLGALLSSAVWIGIGKAWSAALSTIPAFRGIDEKYSSQAPLFLGAGILLFFLAVLIHYLLSTFESAREAERQSLELKVLAREAELRALKAQIDPHFLFNSLNSISALSGANPAGARQMCQLLADFFRRSLALGQQQLIRLEDEIALVSNFLAVEEIRLGPRLTVTKRIEEPTGACLVPSLILQPLVENAIRHGISQLVEGGTIHVLSRMTKGQLIMVIENPCEADCKGKRRNGIGLQNVRARLAAQYGSDARMEIERGETHYRVRIVLPARMDATKQAG